MKRSKPTFATPKGQATLEKMRQRLRESTANLFDLAGAIGKSKHSAALYLQHLRDLDQVECVADSVPTPHQGALPAIWALKEEGAPCDPMREDGEFERVVVVRKCGEWEPNHTRMWMDCYLFGVPAVLQGVAA